MRLCFLCFHFFIRKQSLSMLSKQQKLLLAQLVKEHKLIVLAPFSSTVTKKVKQEAWEKIRRQLNGVGANIDSAKTLRDVLWANIRRATLKKVSESKKTGTGGSEELTELDETVLDVFRPRKCKHRARESRRFGYCIWRGDRCHNNS